MYNNIVEAIGNTPIVKLNRVTTPDSTRNDVKVYVKCEFMNPGGSIKDRIGWWLIVEEGERLFGGIFGGVGGLIALFCAYLMLNSLEVSRDGMGIKTVRRVLGIPVRRRYMSQGNFERFEKNSTMQTQSGGKHVMFYSVYAVDRQGNKIIVGEGFKGDSEANAAIRLISREFGLREAPADRGSRNDGDGLLGPEVLT